MTDMAPAGRGSLARVIATRGGTATPEAPFVIEHREALIYMLCEAAELEHAIMCQYLYAAFSLKQRGDEGLNSRELERVDRWRKAISHIATQEMLHLALVQNLLSAVGGAPHLTRPNLPQPAGHYPPGVILTLLPFGEDALRHFMFLERPEGMDLHDAPGLDAVSRAAPMMQQGDIVPRLQDFATVGHLYRSIEEGVKHLCAKYGESWLFVGPPEAQAKPEHFGWTQLVQVVGAQSAQRAVDTILDQGEGPRGHWRKAHFGQFVEILDEYLALKKANPSFEPSRSVLPATVRPGERDGSLPLIGDAFTASCTDLFNVVYEVLLLVLERYFAHTEETDEEIATLARVTLGLMFNAIEPLGSLLTALPVGNEAPGRTAGPSFELFYESDSLLPHRNAAWVLIEERIRESAAFAERLCQEHHPEAEATLGAVGSALLDLAHTLAVCRVDHGGVTRAGEVTVAHRRLDAEAARADRGVAQKVGRLTAALEQAVQSRYRSATRALLSAANLKADTNEGGVDESQAAMVQAWKRSLVLESDRHFDAAADLMDLLVGVRGSSEVLMPDLDDATDLGDRSFSTEAIEQMMSEWTDGLGEIVDLIGAVPPEALLLDPRPAPRNSALEPTWRFLPIVDPASAIAVIEGLSQNPSTERPDDHGDTGDPPTLPQIRRQLEAALRDDPSGFRPTREGQGNVSTAPAGQEKTRLREHDSSVLALLFRDTFVAMLSLQGQGLGPEPDPISARYRQRNAADRLRRSVLRPLAESIFQLPSDPAAVFHRAFRETHDGHDASYAARIRKLTHDATETLQRGSWPHELFEAVAGLQDLALEGNTPDSAHRDSLISSWPKSESRPSIRLVRNGPYVLTNVDSLTSALGESVPTRPHMAMCRCGCSAAKPWCDGSHARVDFTGVKDPNRVPDRRDTYEGLSITILDNRGICQHSGFCTDRVPVAFRVDEDPFVAPSGARLDEMIRAVRNCPSGALSLAVDEVEDRAAVDWHDQRSPALTITQDGPYRITGSIQLLDEMGVPVVRNTGSSLEHYALCRCGHSQNKPFCSGMHWYVGFRDPVPEPRSTPTLFEWAGGFPTIRRMVDLFFERYVPEDPMLAPMFANARADHSERVASWFGEVLGGPASYQAKFGDYVHFIEAHKNLGVTEDQLTSWVDLLFRSARETGLKTDPEFWSAFTSYVECEARRVWEGSQPNALKRAEVNSPRWDWGPAGPASMADEEPGTGESSPQLHVPEPGEIVSFDAHIKPLFREKDQRSMSFAFDLWSSADVCSHAEDIVSRLRAGTMPCDGAWSQEKLDLFQRWIDGGCSE
jgi:CDGSH-type Zn-finger protein/truncated hemoglobin YjbI